MRFDAIVIGAGPAGSTVAQLLAVGGWHVALVEKDEFPRRKVCGEFISTPTHNILDLCGVGDAFRLAAGPEVRRIALFSGETVVSTARDENWGRALGREHLDLMLRNAAEAAGAVLFQPAELVGLSPEGQVHFCRLKTGDGEHSIAAPILIAATGSWRTKPPLAVQATESPGDLLAFKAHFSASRLPVGIMPLLAFPGGYGGLVHTDGKRTSLSCCIRRDALTSLRWPGERAGVAVLRHIRATTRGARDALLKDPEEAILSAGPIRPGIRAPHAEGIFRTGNLAGEAHPVIAEGISMAIQSSQLLANRLLAQGAVAGPSYSTAWLKCFGPRLRAANMFAQIALHAPGLGTALVRSFPELLTWGAKRSGKNRNLIAYDGADYP